MKKFTKKQREAVEYLALDMDELSNKPRRLFSSFRRFIEAFIEGDRQPEIIADMNQWEEYYYASINDCSVLQELGNACRRTKRDMREDYIKYHKDDMENFNSYMYTVDETVKSVAKKLAESIINDIY